MMVIPRYGTLLYLQWFRHQAQQPANLVPLLYPYLADWIYPSLTSGYHQFHPIQFGGLKPNEWKRTLADKKKLISLAITFLVQLLSTQICASWEKRQKSNPVHLRLFCILSFLRWSVISQLILTTLSFHSAKPYQNICVLNDAFTWSYKFCKGPS